MPQSLIDLYSKTTAKANSVGLAKQSKLNDYYANSGLLQQQQEDVAQVESLGQYGRSEFNDADTTGFTKQAQQVRLGTPGMSAQGQWVDTPESPYTATHKGIYNPETRKKEIRNLTPQEDAAYRASLMELDNYASGVVATPKSAAQALRQHPLSARDQAIYDSEMKKINMLQPKMGAVGVQGQMDVSGKRQIGDFYTAQGQRTGESLSDRLLSTGNAELRQGGIQKKTEGTGGWNDMPGTGIGNGMLGNMVDVAQSSAIQLGAGAIRMVDKVATKLGINDAMDYMDRVVGGDGKAGIILKDKDGLPFTNKTIREVLDPKKGQAIADAMAGVDPEVRQAFSQDMRKSEEDWKNGKYLDSMWGAAKNLDLLLAQSAPETATMMIPYAGAPLVAATRASNQAEQYKQNNNGKEFDANQYASSFLTNLALLLPEKILIKSGIKDVFAGTGSKVGSVSRSTAGEFAQEYGEGVQETYATQKDGAQTLGEIATSPEALYQGAVGGLMGGGLSIAGMAPSMAMQGAGAVTSVANVGLNKLAEVSTDKTVADVVAKKIVKDDIAKQVFDRRVALSEAMDEKTTARANKVNELLDNISTLDLKSPEYTTEVKSSLDMVDALRTKMNIQPTVEETTQTTTPADVASKIAKGETLTDADLQVQANEGKAVEDALQTMKQETEEAPQYDEKTTERMNAAGISHMVTVNDRMNKIGVELDESLNVKEMSKKKGKLFDPYAMTEDRVSTILDEGLNTTTDKDVTFMQRIGKKLGYNKEQHQAVKEVAKNVAERLPEVQAEMEAILGPNTKPSVANAMRAISVAVNTIQSGAVAEEDIRAKAGVERTTEGTRKLGVVEQVGRAYINSFGARLTGEPEATAKGYKEKGDAIISLLEKLGMVEEGTSELSAHGMVTAEGKTLTEGTASKIGHARKDPTTGTTMINLKTLKLTSDETTGMRKNKNKVADALSTFSKLFTPPNYELVTDEGQDKVVAGKGAEGVKISDTHEKIIKNYSKLKYQVKPEGMALFRELKKLLDAVDGDMDRMLSNNPEVAKLLGLKDSNSALTKMSESGQKINRTGSLANVLKNMDLIEEMMAEEDGFNYHYESAINERIHVLQTMLEYQGDKYMARQMVTGGQYTTKTADEYKLVLDEVMDKLNVTEEQVFNPTGELAKAYEWMNKQKGVLTLDQLVHLSGKLKMDRPFETLSAVRAAWDISKGDGKSVTSSYMIESDASASGVVNTLFNLAGYPGVADILQSIEGIGVGEQAKLDPYKILSTQVEKMIGPDGTYANAEEVNTVMNRMQSVLGKGEGEYGKFLRDLAKYAMMPWFYGQRDANTAYTMGNSIAVDIAKEAVNGKESALEWVNEILGSNYSLPTKPKLNPATGKFDSTPISDISTKDIKKMSKYFADSVGNVHTKALNEVFGAVVQYRSTMDNLYTLLESTGQWKGTIQSAMGAVLETDTKMSIQKLKNMTLEDINKELVSVNKMMNNKTSFKVNLQHATDAALLLLTLRDVMLTKGTNDGIMTVHDAMFSDPATAIQIMRAYNKHTVDVAMKYDYLSAAISEAEQAISKMTDEVGKRVATAQLQTIKDKTDGVLENKRTVLKGMKTRILGNKGINIWAEEKGEMVTEEVVQEKPESEKEVQEYNEVEYATVKNVISTMINSSVKDMGKNLKKMMKRLEVPKSHQKLYEKVLSALEDPTMTFSKGDRYEAFSKKVKVDVDRSSRRTDIRSGEAHTVESLIETLAHEIDHAYQLDYIDNNKNATDVRYMQRLVDKIMNEDNRSWRDNLSEKAADRVDYVKSVDTNDKIPELVAILMSEPDVAVEIQKYLAGSQMMRMLEAFIAKVQEYVNKLLQTNPEKVEAALEKGMSSNISVKNINAALMSLDHNARANSLKMTAKKKPVRTLGMAEPKDVNEHMFMAPYNYVNDVIAAQNSRMSDWMIIWGDTMLEHMGPPVAKWHRYMKINHKLYREGMEMIRHGFYDSDFAKRMHETLGLSGDSKQVLMNKVQTLAADYQQASKQHLIEMAEMHRQIKDEYSKADQKVIHRMFNDTAIANLGAIPELREKILNGTMSLKDALESLKVKGKEELDSLAEYYVTGETKTGLVNMTFVQDKSEAAKMYVTLKAMSMIPGSQKLLSDMKPDLRKWMMSIALLNRDTTEEINERGMGYDGQRHSDESTYKNDYDGSMSKEVYTKVMETKLVTLNDMKKTENSSEYEWIVLKEPTKDSMGVIGRENLASGYTTGVGLELNRYVNGVMTTGEESAMIASKLEGMEESDQAKWLVKNGMVRDGNRFRVLLSKEVKREKMGLIEDAAETLYRTFIHNKDLIASEAVRRTLLENGTRRISSLKGMDALEELLKRNYKEGLFGLRTEVDPFLSINYESAEMKDIQGFDDLKRKYPMIAQHYKTPAGLTTYNGFNQKVTLVQRGVYEELLGHKNASIFGNTTNREAARWENLYKKIVVLAKQKMIVMNPVKLLNDTISNLGVLGMMDMSPAAIYDGMKKGWSAYHEYSAERTKLVQLEMDVRIAEEGKPREWAMKKLKAQEEKLKTMEFYKAHEYGFVQSYGTELVVKEFDTISGIQNDINNAVDKYTHDAKGDPNSLFKAIKWFMTAGVNVDELMYKAGNNAKMKGTTIGEELVSASERLKNKKNDKESVAAYVSELIGAPSSSAAAYGGAYMVLSDALSKYVLAEHLKKQVNPKSGDRQSRRLYTEEEAYMKANETFIDYRKNIPSEVKALSDYGILMFPAYWLRVQKVIGGLLKYHPVSTILSYGVEMSLGVGNLNVVNQALPIKAAQYGGLLHAPWEIVSPEAVAGGIFISI
jgi:hypothetical protein